MSVPPSQPRANVGSILRVLGTPKANLLCFHLGKKLLQQTPYFLQNFLLSRLSVKDTVIPCLPDVDILCLQEVW